MQPTRTKAVPGLLLGTAVLLGILLRVHQLHMQIVADDEWHALHALMAGRFIELATHFGAADYCIPLALVYKTAYTLIGLSEAVMRAPVLLFGIGLLAVCPLITRLWLGRTASLIFAWLLAVSPLLIFYSRYARPYVISTWFCFVGAAAFFQWWKGSRRLWKWVYGVCAVLGPCFHLSVLPFVMAPVGFGMLELSTGRAGSRTWRELGKVFILILLGIGFCLGPAFTVDQEAWSGKLVRQSIGFSTIEGALELLVGTSSLLLLFVVLGLAVAGMILLLYRRP